MTLIKTVSPEAAEGEIAEIYQRLQQAMGRIPAPFVMRSASPFQLQQQMNYLGYYVQHPSLSMALLACVRMLVSQRGQCDYCIDFNAGLLINMLGWTPDQVAATKADVQAAPLPEKDRAMLAFVLKGVADPHAVSAADLDALRALGWSDGDIMDGLNHGAGMVAGDILINAFKVERDF